VSNRIRGHVQSNVVAYLALFVSLGGVSYAAATIGSAQIKNNSVRSKDIRNRTLVTTDISRKTVASLRGKQGPPGPLGPQGPRGATGVSGNQTLELGAYSTALPANMTPAGSGCVEHASDNNILNARLDLPLPAGAAITQVRARYIDTSNGAESFTLRRVVFDGSSVDDIVAQGTSQNSPGEGLTTLTPVNLGEPLAPVSDTVFYYLIVSKSITTHTGQLAFCGLAVDYTLK
jgi:hypothetical protein